MPGAAKQKSYTLTRPDGRTGALTAGCLATEQDVEHYLNEVFGIQCDESYLVALYMSLHRTKVWLRNNALRHQPQKRLSVVAHRLFHSKERWSASTLPEKAFIRFGEESKHDELPTTGTITKSDGYKYLILWGAIKGCPDFDMYCDVMYRMLCGKFKDFAHNVEQHKSIMPKTIMGKRVDKMPKPGAGIATPSTPSSATDDTSTTDKGPSAVTTAVAAAATATTPQTNPIDDALQRLKARRDALEPKQDQTIWSPTAAKKYHRLGAIINHIENNITTTGELKTYILSFKSDPHKPELYNLDHDTRPFSHRFWHFQSATQLYRHKGDNKYFNDASKTGAVLNEILVEICGVTVKAEDTRQSLLGTTPKAS